MCNITHLLILGDRECGKTTRLRTWLHELEQRFTPEQVGVVLIDFRKTLLEFQRSPYLLTYAATMEQVKDAILRLKEHLEQRLEASQKQTGEPRTWAGQQWNLVVDDYESVAIMTSQTSNPLNPLEPFVQAGRELGFHLLLARRVTDFGRNAYDPFSKASNTWAVLVCPCAEIPLMDDRRCTNRTSLTRYPPDTASWFVVAADRC